MTVMASAVSEAVQASSLLTRVSRTGREKPVLAGLISEMTTNSYECIMW